MIPETQLDTWSHQGSITQSSATYATIKRSLEASDAGYANKNFHVFLQGSYGNDTNVYAESDVDVDVCRRDAAASAVGEASEELVLHEAAVGRGYELLKIAQRIAVDRHAQRRSRRRARERDTQKHLPDHGHSALQRLQFAPRLTLEVASSCPHVAAGWPRPPQADAALQGGCPRALLPRLRTARRRIAV